MRQVHYAILQLIEISQVSVNKNEHNAYRLFYQRSHDAWSQLTTSRLQKYKRLFD